LTTNEARRGIALLDRELKATQIDETTYWSTNSARKTKPASDAIAAHLLPAYDEYNVAYKNRQHVFDPRSVSQISAWGALGPTVVAAGRIVGIWKGAPGRNSVEINIEPARELDENELVSVSKAATRYAAFLDLPLRTD
jgi:hypothetical protein